MGQRKHIAIRFEYNTKWIGGTYYLLNLIHALKSLPDNIRPRITIISANVTSYKYIKAETDYPYLTFIKDLSSLKLWQKALNAFALRSLKKKIITPRLQDNFDIIFPNPSGDYFSLIPEDKKIYWIPDFQEAHLPHLFSADEIVEIKQRQIFIAYKAKKIVLSSKDAKKDFNTLYPYSKAEVFVVPFSVTHPKLFDDKIDDILRKYTISKPYYFSPNQFWMHKNHIIVIKAVEKLVKQHKDILIIFSGKEIDYRNPGYTESLKKIVCDKGLESNIKFLGFLDRSEQLLIMKYSKAVIQPSIFEGWSTVVEDAKALNKMIIVSNLNVHKEQLSPCEDYTFFDPFSEDDLIMAITKQEKSKNKFTSNDYTNNVRIHVDAFLDIINAS